MLPVSYVTRSKLGASLMETHRKSGNKSKGSSLITTLLALFGTYVIISRLWDVADAFSSSDTSTLAGLDHQQRTHKNISATAASLISKIPDVVRHATTATTKQHRAKNTNRRSLDVASKASSFPAPRLKTLVLVACHSVFTGLDFAHPEDLSSWYLLDYQKKVPGQTHSFVEHIKLGVAHAAADPEAMLLFSGGKTRRDAGPRAEAMGYWLVAEANKWFGQSSKVRNRAFTEEHARDSFENVLFGLCRFFELTGHFPSSIVVVGYDFKKDRFDELHRRALRWPGGRFNYVGTPALTEGAEAGEAATASAFELDPYGCHPPLSEKRASRDPFADGGYAGERCPEMAELLAWCGPGVYAGPLPWDQ